MSGNRNSNMAVVLSVICSGVGQIYNGELGKGLLLFFGFSMPATLFYILSLARHETGGGIFTTLSLACWIGHIAGWVYSVMDAYDAPESNLTSKQWLALEENRKRNERSILGDPDDSRALKPKSFEPIQERVCQGCQAVVPDNLAACPKCGRLFPVE
jgi:TM2 domain-containing membrane protein YozV